MTTAVGSKCYVIGYAEPAVSEHRLKVCERSSEESHRSTRLIFTILYYSRKQISPDVGMTTAVGSTHFVIQNEAQRSGVK